MILAAATAEPSRGWGGPIAILAAFAVFRMLMPGLRRLWDKIQNPSPTPALPTAERVKAKATVGVTPNDTPDTPEPEEGWWGRIVEVGGHRYRQARQVMATGSHELPPDDEPDAPAEDPEIDLALDDEQEDKPDRPETVNEFITRVDTGNVSDGLIASAVMKRYGGSESTARRRIRSVRADKRGKLQNAE